MVVARFESQGGYKVMSMSKKGRTGSSQRVERAAYLVEFLTARARTSLRANDPEAAVGWIRVAADQAWNNHPGFFASEDLESMLLAIGQDLPQTACSTDLWPRRQREGRRVLHVLTAGYESGGHTRLTERWIRRGATRGETHSVVILEQDGIALPGWLAAAAGASGGTLVNLSGMRDLERAALLRQLWVDGPDCLISHVHPQDPLPVLAFGTEPGPPVLWMNHADHVFWLGVSVADLVLDMRLTGQWYTLNRRGARKSQILPIPLIQQSLPRDREETRRRFGVRDGTTLMLTIGSPYKYAPLTPWDFPLLVGQVLRSCPDVSLLAVGPTSEWGWKRLAAEFPTRVFPVGTSSNLPSLYAASDLYLESFPVGGVDGNSRRGDGRPPGAPCADVGRSTTVK
jgi:hypothetical protein